MKLTHHANLGGIINTEDNQHSIQGEWGTSKEQMPGKSHSVPLLWEGGKSWG